MTLSTQPRRACQEKGNFGDGISSIFFICVRSWAAVSLPDWSGAKNLVRQPKEKSTSEELISKAPKGITFWSGHVLIFLLQYQLAEFCSRRGKKREKGCFVCLHCLLRESRMPHILELPSLFIYLFTYGQQKDFSFVFPELGRKVK